MISVKRTLSATEMVKYGSPKLTVIPENKLDSGLEVLKRVIIPIAGDDVSREKMRTRERSHR